MSEYNNQNPWEQQNDKQPEPIGQQPEAPEQTQEQYQYRIQPAEQPESRQPVNQPVSGEGWQTTQPAVGWRVGQAQPAPQQPRQDWTQPLPGSQPYYGASPRPYEPKQKAKAHKPGRMKGFFRGVAGLVLVAAVSVGSAAGYLHWAGYRPGSTNGADSSAGSGGTKVVYQPAYSEDSLTAAQIYESNVSSVVAITTQMSNGSGVGTGIIMREDGYIITNDHVVSDAVKITVRTYDGKEYDAEIIGTDEKTDIAVIKIQASGLKAATFGDSDQAVVGEPAIVIGNPLGLEFANTMTQGSISSVSRDIEMGNYIMNLMQTDAAINPGNSGGPMFNSRGEVIGVVSAKIKTSEAVGIGFAIPSNTALKVAQDFINFGSVQDRPMLGVTVEGINAYYAQMQGVEMGVRVAEVVRGGAADLAGIEVGDYIASFNGAEVTTISDLNYAKDKCKVGDTVKVELRRNGETLTVDLVLKDANQLAS